MKSEATRAGQRTFRPGMLSRRDANIERIETDMRKTLGLLLAPLLLIGSAAGAGAPIDHEAELARAIAGREPGRPVSFISLHRVNSTRVITDTALIYEAGSTIYVNRPRAGADSLNRWDAVVTRLPTTQLCSIDTVTMVDMQSGFMTGVVFLGEFVPYTRVRHRDR